MNNKVKYLTGLFLIVLLSASACKEDDQIAYEFPDPVRFVELPEEWELQNDLMQGFPEDIEVYRNTTSFMGKKMNAYCVIFDPQNAQLEFKPVLAATNTKVSDLYAREEGTVYACINGGFFGTNVSYSLVQYNNELEAVNIKSLTRPYNGSNATYYPTRGAFGLKADNAPEVTWMYNVGSENVMYSYPAPSPNELNAAPQPQPTAEFPEGGEVWDVISAIGGSPVLISQGAINITDTEELISIDNNSSRARSAIGHTAEGKIILLAVEGNNPQGGTGLDLQEMAELMKSMGCTGALNLDGGGSTFMMVNGKPTVEPSGSERAVMSAIIIKKK